VKPGGQQRVLAKKEVLDGLTGARKKVVSVLVVFPPSFLVVLAFMLLQIGE
jgi:hypothetical protein